jgi:hypothetical protein
MAEARSYRQLSGGCLCGAVRFVAAPKETDFGVCHCSMCRRWSAGPFFALECGGTLQIENGEERCFCKVCGTPLFYRLVGKDFYAVSTEAFDDSSGFAFTSQIFIDEKPAYYEFANKTKTMTGAEVFAAFAQDNQSTAQE